MTITIPEVEASDFLKSIRSFEQMYEDIATLLINADEIMCREKWLPLDSKKRKNQAVAHASKSIKLPSKWLPLLIYREYANKLFAQSELCTTAFIAVTLDYPYPVYDQKPISDPFLAAGYYVHAQERLKDWPCLYAANLHAGNVSEHTGFVDIKTEWVEGKVWKKYHDSFYSGRSKAVVLSTIKTQENLQKLIVDPLLAELRPITPPSI